MFHICPTKRKVFRVRVYGEDLLLSPRTEKCE